MTTIPVIAPLALLYAVCTAVFCFRASHEYLNHRVASYGMALGGVSAAFSAVQFIVMWVRA